jgi:raffinose/stachyose/melibiose transport system substrate-binding protein
MTTRKNRPMTRRDFLKLSGLGLTVAGLSPLIQSCGGAPATTAAPAAATQAPLPTGKNLKAWWWGEQEAPGLEKWLNESIDIYKQKSGNTIEPTLQDTAVVISEFQTASAANDAPDIQFFWNGTYHMESAWLGYVEPLDGLIPVEEINASQPTILSVYGGKTYRMGWYAVGLAWLYNKEMFSKVGLNPDTPPKTWDEFLNACDKLKSAGLIPIGWGLKDGYMGEWWMGHGLGQNLDTIGDAISLFIGDLDWRDPKYYEHWGKLGELWDAGYFNDDMMSLEYTQGIDMFGNSQAAMTNIVIPFAAKEAQLIGGSEKIGVMPLPVFGTGKMAGKPISDCQGFGISSQSKNKEVAADFLRSMHTPERVQALWEQTGVLPMDTSFDGNAITDPLFKAIWDGWVNSKEAVTYVSDLMPVLFWTDAMFVNSQKIITGEYTAEQAGQNAYDVTQKWVEQNPDLVKNYAAWAKELGAM